MPTFPTYHGELPQCLNLFNLRHYFLLAYWVYFRPTALKNYLYHADPDLYRSGSGWANFRHAWHIPPLRNLYLMIPGASLLLSVLVVLPFVLIVNGAQGSPVNWFDIAFDVAGGVAVGIACGIAFGVVGGVPVGVAFGMTFGVAFSVAADMPVSVAGSLIVGLIVGVAFSVAGDVAFGVAFGVGIGVGIGVFVGVGIGVFVGMVVGVAFSVAFSVGALRALFYPLQLVFALYNVYLESKDRVELDKLTVLPLPGIRRALSRQLQQNKEDGLRAVAEVARNPFQRWAAQNVLQSYLHNQALPLHFLYRLLTTSSLNEYLFTPVGKYDWELTPSIREVLLAELNGVWFDVGLMGESMVWRITYPLRDRRKTPLTHFAGLLHKLLDKERVESDHFDLSRHREVYTDLTGYPGGQEIAGSFETMHVFLSYREVAALPAAVGVAAALAQDAAPIRPAVMTALRRLGEIGAEVATYQAATSRVNQLAALARATDALDDLDTYADSEVMDPERRILRRIIRQWRRLISEVGGEVGRETIAGPVANPYVAGNPVTGSLFVGREDIMRRLEELWAKEGQCPSVVIFGHRRMGKSSILHNLGVGARFGTRTAVVDFNMQRVGLVESTGELLYNLALSMYDSLSPAQQHALGEPDEQLFIARNPYTAFDRFIKKLDRVRDGWRLIIAVDEFELIERLIDEQRLEPQLLDFWRGLIQTYPWYIMAFAGLHTLQEMTQDYWNPLFGSVTRIPVSFLGRGAAQRLLTQPSPDFSIDYDPQAIERIMALTNGQPYLMQLIGHALVTRFNRQTFEEGVERARRFTPEDVEAVISTPEFYRDGDAYFTGVWSQAATSEPAGQTDILRALSGSPLSLAQLTDALSLPADQTEAALQTLQRHDVIAKRDDTYVYTVELMRQWVVISPAR